MKVKTSNPDEGQVVMTIIADAEEVSSAITYLVTKCSMENAIESGESPDLEFAVRAKLGNAYVNAYLDSKLPQFLAAKAVGQERLETILSPELIRPLPTAARGRSVEFKARVWLKPRLELSSYDPVSVDIWPIEVTEVDIDEQLLLIAENNASYDLDEDGQPIAETRVIPAITDSWVAEKVPEAADVPGLRAMLLETMTLYREQEQQDYISYAAASELAKRVVGSYPDKLIELTRNDLLSALQRNLEAQGRSLQEFIATQGGDATFNYQLSMQANEVLRQGFALDALARHEGLSVTSADLELAFQRMAPGYEEMAGLDYLQTGRMYVMEEAALRIKANNWLAEHAIVHMHEAGEEVAAGEAAADPEVEEEAPDAPESAAEPEPETEP